MAGILSYALKLDTAGFTSPLRDANAKLGGLKLSAGSGSGGLAGLSATAAGATAVFTAFGAAVASSLGVLRSYAEFDGLVRGLKTLDGTSEATAARLERLRDVAKVPGLGFEEAVRGDIKLRAVGMSADLSEKAMRAFGNALATVGGGKSDLDGVLLALTQMAAKGKVSAEEINQISERVPQVRAAMKTAFGTADTEALGKSGVTASAFIEKLVAELGKLPQVMGGARNAVDNFDDSWKALKTTATEFFVGITSGFVEDVTKGANLARRKLEELKKILGIKTPGLEGKDGKTETTRQAEAAAAATTKAAADAAAEDRSLAEANAGFWAGLAQEKIEQDKQIANRKEILEKSNQARVKAAEEQAYAAKLTKEEDLQRQIGDLKAMGPREIGRPAIDAATPGSDLQATRAENTAKLVSLEKELLDLQKAARDTAQSRAEADSAKLEAATRQRLQAVAQATAEAAAMGEATAMFGLENALLQAQAGGNRKRIQAAQDAINLERIKLSLLKDQGLTEDAALAKAKERLAMEKQAAAPKQAKGILSAAAATAARLERKAMQDQKREERRDLFNPQNAAKALARGAAAADPNRARREAAAEAAAAVKKANEAMGKNVAGIFDILDKNLARA
jgi:tape measure domain-containing protein